MEVEVKLTREQNDLLLEKLGSEESIQKWLQDYIDNAILRLEEERKR